MRRIVIWEIGFLGAFGHLTKLEGPGAPKNAQVGAGEGGGLGLTSLDLEIP